jgi:hypothetical protein
MPCMLLGDLEVSSWLLQLDLIALAAAYDEVGITIRRMSVLVLHLISPIPLSHLHCKRYLSVGHVHRILLLWI